MVMVRCGGERLLVYYVDFLMAVWFVRRGLLRLMILGSYLVSLRFCNSTILLCIGLVYLLCVAGQYRMQICDGISFGLVCCSCVVDLEDRGE